MIKSISLWSFPEKLNLEQCFVLAKKLGYPAVEMTCDLKDGDKAISERWMYQWRR